MTDNGQEFLLLQQRKFYITEIVLPWLSLHENRTLAQETGNPGQFHNIGWFVSSLQCSPGIGHTTYTRP